jgi:[ribosomal protein S5]-alanine N-acetyltransferase
MNIHIEKVQKKDAEKLFQFEKENRAFFETMVPSRGDEYYIYDQFLTVLEELLKEQSENTSFFYLIKDEWAHIVGRINLVDIHIENRSASIGYRIGKAFLKKGIASKALELMLKETEKLNVKEIHAKTTYNNIGSRKVLENNGFVRFFSENEADSDFVHYIWRQKLAL